MSVDIEFLRRLEKSRFERRLHQKSKKKERNSLKSRGVAHYLKFNQKNSGPHQKYAKKWFDIEVPRALDLINQKDATCTFLEGVRKNVKAGRRIRLIFQETQSISQRHSSSC